ncbi:zinc transporter 1 [Teleopsis dalmanni]|uniref:zinc transporter 1 n=1 Tax=Teleopsis dalmanni TaxID=139649 RepID=UPI0018CF19DB|nr:zinc transporter 1 [Teleopsis dalmanni]XP_037934775.1 zinc transporter 1 [Teleopsis dalmanni]
MPIKNLLLRFQPAQLYIVLVLSICYFAVQLVLSHITHALTLLMASYHMLCNIFALTGCILTIKHSKRSTETSEHSKTPTITGSNNTLVISLEEQSLAKRERSEFKLRNTFGWTRIDILTMLIVCIILASLSFSLLVEALQTLVHIDHQDTMHLPIPVMILGFMGLVLNGLTYLLIGGYTMHQGSFLHVTPSGDVVLDRAMSNSTELTLKPDERQLSKSKNDQQLKEDLQAEIGQVHYTAKRQGTTEMLRDVSSTIFVIVCALIVYIVQNDEHTTKFIDPVLSILSCVILVSLSYPYMKESCLILLQTIPGSIDMENFESNLISKFPQIINYHDLHIWQLSAHKSVATVHIKFKNHGFYAKMIDDVRAYFHAQGITEVTIQPEFHCAKSLPSLECLVQCSAPECAEKVCCRDSRSDLRDVTVCPNGSSEKVSNNGLAHNVEKQRSNSKCNEKPKELKISNLLKFNRKIQRTQSTNDINKVVETKTTDIKKTISESQILQEVDIPNPTVHESAEVSNLQIAVDECTPK